MRISTPGSGRPTVSGANRTKVVQRIGSAGLRQAIAVRNLNAEIIEKLQGLRLSERATHK